MLHVVACPVIFIRCVQVVVWVEVEYVLATRYEDSISQVALHEWPTLANSKQRLQLESHSSLACKYLFPVAVWSGLLRGRMWTEGQVISRRLYWKVERDYEYESKGFTRC